MNKRMILLSVLSVVLLLAAGVGIGILVMKKTVGPNTVLSQPVAVQMYKCDVADGGEQHEWAGFPGFSFSALSVVYGPYCPQHLGEWLDGNIPKAVEIKP